MAKPDLSTIPSWYHNYVRQVPEEDLLQALQQNTGKVVALLQEIPAERWSFRYAEEKWSIKELVQHIIDAERIFCYRALCFARQDKTELPGFDENTYARHSHAEKRSKDDLISEFGAVRAATEKLFQTFDEEQLASVGIANQNPVSVNGIGFIIVGHVIHHMNILNERYLG